MTATAPAPTNGQATTTALATVDPSKPAENAAALRTAVLSRRQDFEGMFGPKEAPAAMRLMMAVITEWVGDPKLQKCTLRSIMKSALQIAELKLTLGKQLGEAFIVPYGSEASFLLGYRGMCQLAYRSGKVAGISVDVVRKGETYKAHKGSRRWIEHDVEGDRTGQITHYYATVQLKSGFEDYEVMTAAEAEEHRQKYAPNNPAYQKSPTQMYLKAPLRRLLKRCPIGIDMLAEEVFDEPGEAAIETPAPKVELPASSEPTGGTDDTADADFTDADDDGGDEEYDRMVAEIVEDPALMEQAIQERGQTFAAFKTQIEKLTGTKLSKSMAWPAIPEESRRAGVEWLLTNVPKV